MMEVNLAIAAVKGAIYTERERLAEEFPDEITYSDEEPLEWLKGILSDLQQVRRELNDHYKD